MTKEEQILGWLGNGKPTGRKLIDLKWKISRIGDYYTLENEKVPFTLFLYFIQNKIVQVKLDTGIETATSPSRDRLGTYRTLLIMNGQVSHVKFMVEGINENVVARVDMEMQTITKAELDEALNALLSSLYMMVRALHLEEEFNKQIVDRMLMLVKEMQEEGKSKVEIVEFLKSRMGFREEDAKRIVEEFLTEDLRGNERLYG